MGILKRVFLGGMLLTGVVSASTVDHKIDSLIQLMTLTEKMQQLSNNSGVNGNTSIMTTYDNERLGIPGFIMNDGPHGVRPLDGVPSATAYAIPISLTAMWDRDMWHAVGSAMGAEFHAYGKHIQLGPSIDLSHNPMNGRTGETASEDSYLSSQFAEYVIKGIQSNPVIATVKHFTGVNRQEYRHTSDITITEQQLMDQYAWHYKRAIQEGGALAVMSAYNLLNGVHASESELLLTTILKERWGYPFFVMSDWDSVHDTEKALNAGNDLCMGSPHYRNYLETLVQSGTVSEETVNESVRRVLKSKMLAGLLDPEFPEPDASKANTAEHQKLAREADQKAMILLKNSDAILPLSKSKTVALIGPNADVAIFNIYGSSYVYPPYSVSPKQGIEDNIGAENVTYVRGCDLSGSDVADFEAAKSAAQASDYVLFFGGLSDDFEGESIGDGGDRKTPTVQLPQIQKDLISELAKVNPNVVVVLQSGGVVAVEDVIDDMKGLIYSFYTSMEGGNAFADVLFGEYNPAGRLPMTLPLNDASMPEWNDDFTDDFFDGYRFYAETGNDYQYAFGYGLSYTTFEYGSVSVQPAAPKVGDRINVTVEVSNTGDRDGEEVVQLYMNNNASPIWHPKKELIQFKRVAIASGTSEQVTFSIEPEDLFYFDNTTSGYAVADGEYTFFVGGSSDSLPVSVTLDIGAGDTKGDLRPIHLYTYPRFPSVGEEVALLATVKNYGAAPTKNNFIVTWKMGAQVVGRSAVVGSLVPGQMVLVSAEPAEVKAGDASSVIDGNTITVSVDAENSVDERYEQNNIGVFTIPVSGTYVRDSLQYSSNSETAESSDEQISSEEEISTGASSSSIESVSSSIIEEDTSSEINGSSGELVDMHYSHWWNVEFQYNILTLYSGGDISEPSIYTLFGEKVAVVRANKSGIFIYDLSPHPDATYIVVSEESDGLKRRLIQKKTIK